ncbi:MAG: methyltransferase domain-containing protein [Bryobacterales bacterium]|nr:methyltransferase domain-containing protein [Bryobacterales bacterium]
MPVLDRIAAARSTGHSPPELTLAEGRLWCELIESRSGLHFPESHWHYLRRRLWEGARRADVASYAGYYRLVSAPDGAAEWRALLEDLVNPETAFFRHQPSFAALRQRVLAARPPAPLTLWSAGCSTGEEAYSLAMCGLAAGAGAVRVTATDLSQTALRHAARGLYSTRQTAQVPEAWQARFLRRSGAGVSVSGELREAVQWAHFHLLEPETYPAPGFDAVFCFNVLIYFRGAARQQAVSALLRRVKPGGYLFLAPGEAAGIEWTGEAEPTRWPGVCAFRRAAAH